MSNDIRHDGECEHNRADWPQFKEWRDPITGILRPAGPYPCHCLARSASRPFETGDTVAVLSAGGSVAYFGEITSVPEVTPRRPGKYGIWNPAIDEVSYVAFADGEGFRSATEAETDDYIDRWGDPEVFNSDDALGSPE
jgi:hypothetical protein